MNKEIQFLIYNTPREDVKIGVVVKDETLWLTQKAMAILFDVQVPAISRHLSNIYDEGELVREATISILETVQTEGTRSIMRKVANNYLQETEIRRLERIVTGFFDYIEDLIERENTFTMEDFAASVNEFLTLRKYKILTDKGGISKQQADAKAEAEYSEFNKTQKITSDFDKEIKKIAKKER